MGRKVMGSVILINHSKLHTEELSNKRICQGHQSERILYGRKKEDFVCLTNYSTMYLMTFPLLLTTASAWT